MVQRYVKPVPMQDLAHFYRLVHKGLTGPDSDVRAEIVGNCTVRIWHTR